MENENDPGRGNAFEELQARLERAVEDLKPKVRKALDELELAWIANELRRVEAGVQLAAVIDCEHAARVDVEQAARLRRFVDGPVVVAVGPRTAPAAPNPDVRCVPVRPVDGVMAALTSAAAARRRG